MPHHEESRRADVSNLAAVILAGSLNKIPLYEGYKPGHKALLEFNGKPSIHYTLAALRLDPRITRICIVGSTKVLSAALAADAAGTIEHEPQG
ncbi:MAG: hypothetical protein M3R04_03650, partial [bacterium]|nr:hypothetical protein [bacterium]